VRIMGKKYLMAIVPGEVCGGCDMAIIDLHEKLLDVLGDIEIVYWPIAMDFKEEDIDTLEEIDIAIFQGGIRTEKQKELVEKVARKSRVKIAFGACACFGGIPDLADLYGSENILKTAYLESPSTTNDVGVIPGRCSEKSLVCAPKLLEENYKVDDIIDVDIYMPGCPPPTDLIGEAIEILLRHFKEGKPIQKGLVIAPIKTLCDECDREKPETIEISKFRRIHEGEVDPKKCFLAQGIICLGPITRGGCGLKCIKANMPCRGCMGPAPEVIDPGAKMVSALAALVEIANEPKLSDEELAERVKQIQDPVGLFYRFTFGLNILQKVRRRAK